MQLDAETLEIETAVYIYIANSVDTLGIGDSFTSSTNPSIPQPRSPDDGDEKPAASVPPATTSGQESPLTTRGAGEQETWC